MLYFTNKKLFYNLLVWLAIKEIVEFTSFSISLVIRLKTRTPQKSCPYFLPRYNRINNVLLLAGSFSKVNAGSFNAFVSHQVRQKSNVIVFFKEALCISMAE